MYASNAIIKFKVRHPVTNPADSGTKVEQPHRNTDP